MDLIELGWNPFFEEHFKKTGDDACLPARVASERRGLYLVWCERGEFSARISGRLRANARGRLDFPVVGDWVAVTPAANEEKAVIRRLLPRRTRLTRKPPVSGGKKPGRFEGAEMMDGGTTDEQPLASNVDTLFVVSGLDANFNPRRIVRFLVQARASGASPVVLLNKADLCADVDEKIRAAGNAAGGAPVLAVSAALQTGLKKLTPYLRRGETAAFIGSSGVGKSSLINALWARNGRR